MFFLDSWEYRMLWALRLNKCKSYLFSPQTSMASNLELQGTIHARNHLLYAPYASGSLYNHPLEDFSWAPSPPPLPSEARASISLRGYSSS